VHKLFRRKKWENFKAKLEQIQTAYSNKEAKNFCREVNNIRKGFKPQTLLIRDIEGNIVSNKERALTRWSEFYEKFFEWQNVSNSGLVGEEVMCVQTAEPFIEQPTQIETEIATDKLKN
jgi:hypothetical protein